MTGQTTKGWKHAKLDLAGTLVVLISGTLVYLMGVAPVLTVRHQQAMLRVHLARQRQNALQAVARLEDLRAQLAQVRTSLRACPVRLEPAGTLNTRLGRLTELAAKHQLKVDEIQPSEASYGRDYGVIPIRLAGLGNFRTWISFLHQLNLTFPDISVQSFQLNSKAGAPAPEFQVQLAWHVLPRSAAEQAPSR